MRKILAFPLIIFGFFVIVIGIIYLSLFPLILGLICVFQGYQYLQPIKIQVNSVPIEQDGSALPYSEEKRSQLSSYLSKLTEPKLVTVAMFFDGNIDDQNSFCVNLYPEHPSIPAVRKILESLEQHDYVDAIYIQVVEDIPDDGWPFSDRIVVVGDFTEEELQSKLTLLEPFEIGNPSTNLKLQIKKLLPTLDSPIKVVVWD